MPSSPRQSTEFSKGQVDTVVSGLVTPTGLAFLGGGDFLVLEKNTGEVKRVQTGDDGLMVDTVLDLAVTSERGLLGVALHPDFDDDLTGVQRSRGWARLRPASGAERHDRLMFFLWKRLRYGSYAQA